MLKVAITGNIGSGKSIVSHFFDILGIPVFSADKAGHEALNFPKVMNTLHQKFGNAVFDDSGKLSRKNIARVAFSDASKLQQLNAVVHPEIIKLITQWIEMQDDTHPYLLCEAAILFEAGFDRFFDKIITVSAPQELRIKRVMKRDGALEQDIRKRVDNQMDEKLKIQKSDFVIINDDIQPVIPQILRIHGILSCENKME